MTNYIVSGLERSGTSMMMQILYYGGMDVAFDRKRQPDEHNPRGYFELEGGKIINRLMEGTFPMEKYDEKVIKITAYGLKFLPPGNYKIIYMLRDIDEIMASMQKMAGNVDKEVEKQVFERLNRYSIKLMERREDIEYLIVRYNDIIEDPEREIRRINGFLGGKLDVGEAAKAVDPRLYRNRKVKK